MSMDLSLDEVIVRDRSRQTLRNVDSLAASISSVGLLNPPTVRDTSDGWVLVAGERRLSAMQSLGWTRTPVTVAKSIEDELTALYAERDENTQREAFTPAEMVVHAKRIEERERALAKERQRESIRDRDERGRAVSSSAESAELAPRQHRETRAKVAKAVGTSHDTLSKARHVIELAEDPETPPEVAEVAKFAASELAKPHAVVNREHRAVVEAEQRHAEKTVVEAIDERIPGAAAERARKATRARWSRLLSSVAEIPTMSVDAVSAAVTEPELAAARAALRNLTKWFEELDATRRPGLRVVGGDHD